jgi:hypothetical protein
VTEDARASVAFIAGKLISRTESNFLYDQTRAKAVVFSGSISPMHVQVYNHNIDGFISGNGSTDNMNLFDHSRGAAVQLRLNGNQFSGFDFGTGTHFQGNMTGTAITFFDFGESNYFGYTL